MRLLSIVPAFVILAAAGSAFGAVETFNYAGPSLFGQSGGSTSGSIAWTGNWYDAGPGQSMGINAVSIGTVSTETSTASVADYGLGSPVFDSRRSFTPTSNANDLYIWGLVRINNFSTTNAYGGIGVFSGSTEMYLIGQSYQSPNWGLVATNIPTNSGGTVNVASSTPIQNGVTVLLVARLDQVGNTISLWVNPDLTNAAPAPDAVINTPGFDDVDTIALRGGIPNSGNDWQFDNLHVERGSPFGVPNPGAAALIGLGTLAAARRRRA